MFVIIRGDCVLLFIYGGAGGCPCVAAVCKCFFFLVGFDVVF